MTLAHLVLAIGALVFAGLGAWSLARPEVTAALVDLGLTTPTARIDFMAIYGGYLLGNALFLGWCAFRPAWFRPGLAALGLGLLLSGLGRLAGMLTADGPVKPLMTVFLVAELIGPLVCAWCARRLPRG